MEYTSPGRPPAIMNREFIWNNKIGKSISDLNITELHTKNIEEIKSLIYENGVLVFKNQKVILRQLIDFSKLLGNIQVFNLRNYSLPEYPEIVVLNNQNKVDGFGAKDVGHGWHSDASYFGTSSSLDAPL